MAQRTAGELRGTVYDASGAIAANATVMVVNQDTGQTAQRAVDAKGEFTFPLLNPGNYRVQVVAPGFKKYIKQDVALRALETASITVRLEVGAKEEEIIVQAEADQVNVSNGGVAQRLTKEMVAEFPNLNRYGFANASLLPSVNQYEERRETINASVAGAATNRNAFYIDGAEATDPWRGWSPRQPVADAFDEIVVNTAGATPDTGSNFGGTFNAVLKGGTNTFHGGAWYYVRNESLNANTWGNNFSGVKRPGDPNKYYGGQVGGPIVKDKAFFYVTVSRETDETPYSQYGLYAPTPAMISGDFSALPYTIYQPNPNFNPSDPTSTRSLGAFPGNIIPAGMIDPVAKAFWDKYGYSIPSYSNTYSSAFANSRKVMNYNGRLDFNISEKHRLTASGYYFKNKTESPDARVFSISGFSGNTFGQKSHWMELSNFPQTVVNLKHTWMLKPNVFIETHGAYSNMPEQVVMDSQSMGTTLKTLGANDPAPRSDAQELLPSILIGQWWGNPNTAVLFHGWTTDFTSKNLSLGSSMTWIKDSHNVKIGAEFQNGQYHPMKPAQDISNGMNFNGNATSNSNSGNVWQASGSPFVYAFADFLLGQYDTYGVGDKFDATLKSWNLAGYIMDQWRVTPRLTITPGLRYDLNSGITEKNNHLTLYRPGAKSTIFPNAPAGILVAGDPGVPKSLTGKTGGIAPRFNFAYDVSGNGKTAVRGSVGLYYGRDVLAIYDSSSGQGFINKPPFTGASAWAHFGNMSSPWLTSRQERYSTVPLPFTDQNPANFQWPSQVNQLLGIDPDYNIGRSWQWNIAVERELTKGLRLELSYQANRTNNEPTMTYSNLPVFQTGATTSNYQARRPNQFLGDNGYVLSNAGHVKFDQVLLISRIHRSDLYGQLSWTYTLARRNFNGATNNNQANNRDWDQGITNPSYPDLLMQTQNNHSLGGYFVYNLPILRNDKSVLGKVLGGWALATDGYYSFFQKGQSVFTGYDANADSLSTDLANVSGSVTYPKTSLVGDSDKQLQWLTNAGMTFPGGVASGVFTGATTDSGANKIKQPSGWNINASLLKNFMLMGNAKVQVRFEAYNVFNNANLNFANLSLNNADFGMIRGKTSSGPYSSGRRIQLAARLSF